MPIMKANELRLGNYVLDRGRVIICECHHFSMLESYYKDDFKPIPLTEEWLLKFGFEPKGTEPIMFTNGRYNYFPSSKYFGNTRNNGGLIHSNVRHVHQLQNLYFALTGEELKIEE